MKLKRMKMFLESGKHQTSVSIKAWDEYLHST
jgi:hypothetical protein